MPEAVQMTSFGCREFDRLARWNFLRDILFRFLSRFLSRFLVRA